MRLWIGPFAKWKAKAAACPTRSGPRLLPGFLPRAGARDKIGTVVADDKWALAGKLTAIKFKAELAARTQNQIVHAHTEAEARAELKRLISDDKDSAADIAALSRNIDSTLNACFQQHFSEP